jgi:2-methylisocitrate lyase-like PEP mutase family enzyme
MSQSDRAACFRQLHGNRPLVLPNAWDAASARVIELAGALAIATTSAGVSWSHGRGDGEKLRREEMLQAIRYIVQTVNVPVSADIEGGYGSGSTRDVAETVRELSTSAQPASTSRIRRATMDRCCWRPRRTPSAFAPLAKLH